MVMGDLRQSSFNKSGCATHARRSRMFQVGGKWKEQTTPLKYLMAKGSSQGFLTRDNRVYATCRTSIIHDCLTGESNPAHQVSPEIGDK